MTHPAVSRATHDKELPVGKRPLQLYSSATPNGQKVTILLEELLAIGYSGAEYDVWPVDISKGEQLGSGFVGINPTSTIPALVDRSGPAPLRVFEAGAILLYLAEKFGALVPTASAERAECLSWLFWQATDRFAMEAKRILDVLDKRLAEHPYVAGSAYTIADIAILPWYWGLPRGGVYEPTEFVSDKHYPNVARWADALDTRPAVQRGRVVNRMQGHPEQQLRGRHDARDFAKGATAHREAVLDEALDESFPASDPPAHHISER